MQDLDILNIPLNGFRLIEASAGTGKTYSLIIIYLRLLLNLRTKLNKFSYPLTVQEILVVTFTQSSVQELRSRIKYYIQQLRLDCIQGYSNNRLFSKLLSQINNIDLALNILSIAEQDIDNASIFTIHGFCQKVLMENKIECNILFYTSIIEDDFKLYYRTCCDFWRHYFYSLPINIITYIQQYWKNPEALLNDILPYIYGNKPKIQYNQSIQQSNQYIVFFYSTIINCINDIKKQWLKDQNNIIDSIYRCNLNHKVYNKKNLIRWIEIINQWVTQDTINHIVPKHLEYFKSSAFTINTDSTSFYMLSLYCKIEELYKKLEKFPALILDIAICKIRHMLCSTRHLRSEITFNDLIDLMLYHISKNKNNTLSKKILKNYPVAMIDEFQDTDLNQYKIFQQLYSNRSKNNSLILIGDPKQAIYSFRGADIFTYMKIRKLLPHKYNLTINWRSSLGMVNAINQLFQPNHPFIFTDIPFIPSVSAHQNNKYKFIIHNQSQASICFWLHPDKIVTMHNYKIAMTKECIHTIQCLLKHIQNKTAWLENNKFKKRILKKSDITILVRNHEEASLIRSELLKIDIPTVFLSNHNSIFKTIESYELLLLLTAILSPTHNAICTALTTIFFGLTATDIEKINKKIEPEWTKVFEEFSEYYMIWEKNNVFSMIQKIIFRYKIPEKLLSMRSGKSILINILHLGELLNDFSKRLHSKYALIQWLQLNINQRSKQYQLSSEYIVRDNNNHDLIKISTIHQAKGLEFPIIFLPFIAHFQHNKKIFFHDRKSFELYVDFHKSKRHFKLSDEERLSDDLRLLYVAITRSIYHCSIGIAPIARYTYLKKTNNVTDFHHSAIGYLIQNKQPGTAEFLKQHLNNLNIRSNGDIVFRFLSYTQNSIIKEQPLSTSLLSAKQWHPINVQHYNHVWRITSYSELKNSNKTAPNINFQDLLNCTLHNYLQSKSSISSVFTPHTFPKGKVCGDFFHSLFKILDFKNPINTQWLEKQMILYNISLNWTTVVRQWLYTIIHTPLNQYNFTLSKITNTNKQTEFKFFLHIGNELTAKKFDSIRKYHDPLSYLSPLINFNTITGILKGFIDLVFLWNKKYYLLDYKTNWIGDNYHSYTKSNIKLEMTKYCYDLQYQIYTLAIHRFLKNRIISYNYDKDFGGVYYLFIRGMNGLSPYNGIYFYRPTWTFVKKLDNLF